MQNNVARTWRRTRSEVRRCKTLWFGVAWAFLVGAASGAADELRDWTASDVVRLRRVTDAQISPDGSKIAYVLSVPRDLNEEEEKGGPAYAELHLVDRQGVSRAFVTGTVNVGHVKWTPDGHGISFTAKRGDDKEASLWVIPHDGGEARKVVEHATGVGDYDWAPNGKQVCFIATEKEPKQRKKEKDRGFTQEVYEEDWRFSYVWIADIKEPSSLIEPTASASAPTSDPADEDKEKDDEKKSPHRKLVLEGSAHRAIWSPDGDRLAVVLSPNPGVDAEYMYSRIRIVDVAGGQVTQSIENPGKLGDFQWSPDGKHIACIAGADANDPSAGRLMVADVGGGTLDDRLPMLEGDVRSFAWQNAQTLMYVEDLGVQTRLAKVSLLDGQVKELVAAAPNDAVLGGLDLSADGLSAAFSAGTPEDPPEVLFMRHGDKAPRRLTHSNPQIASLRMARQEVVEFAARDGLKLQGILIRPLDEQPDTRYPLVLCVHGGPEAHVSNGWVTRYSEPGQVLAARGIAVFYPNYRGSTGRGVEFSKMGQADAAGKEFDDLVDAAEHFVKTGLVDRARVGVTGGSYGGYATAWCSTKLTEHFAAGVMFVGISDLVAKSGTTDIPNEEMLVHARKWPWENWDFQRERSPITYAPQGRTPLLILHGKDDPRVHPSQSLELYRYLKNIGKAPVRLVWYPGEGHGNRRGAAQLDYCLRLVQWMEHYLVPEGETRTRPPPEWDLGDEIARPVSDADKEAEPE